jgi:hypothetical protein
VESYAEKDVDLLLLGNKNDMEKRVVDAAKAKVYFLKTTFLDKLQ